MTDYSELVLPLDEFMVEMDKRASAETQRFSREVRRLQAERDEFEKMGQRFAETSAEMYAELQRDRDHWKARAERLGQALAFAASAIKSGEPWTPECEKTIGRALNHQEGEQ